MEDNNILEDNLKKSFKFQNRELLDNYVILAVTDIEGTIKHVSTNLCNIFKYKPSELLNKPYTFLIKKDSIITFNSQFNDAKDSKILWKGEVKHSSHRDETIWTDTIISPLFNDDNEHIGFVLASSDITKEKKLKKASEENLLNKKHDKSVLDFMPSISSAVLLKTSSGLHKVLWIISFTVIFLLGWSYFSEIDDIVRSEGKVITTTNVQKISSLDGGVLKELYVKEGDKVKKGQLILKISDLNFKTDFKKNKYTRFALLAKIERLKAQSNQKKILKNTEVMKIDKSIMQNEIELFSNNEKKIEASINILEEQLQQKKNDLNDAYKNLTIVKRNYSLLIKEMKIKKPLVEERIISRVELLQLQRSMNDTESELKKIKGAVPTLKSSINEIIKSIEETKENYKLTSKDELIITYNKLKQIEEDINFFSQKIADTVIVSPSAGIINKIHIKTRGEAISPGNVIAEIIPESKFLLAQIKVSPSDIGFLYVGQKVRLKLRPYDFSLYGSVDSEISYISADTLIDEKDQKTEVYIVNIKSNTKFLGENGNLEIKPGMTVDADIITGKKTILSYILKPIVKSLTK